MIQTTDTSEKVIYSNHLGTVTDKRVILNYKTGTEDIPIAQISSVSFQHVRNSFFAIANFAMAVLILAIMFSMLNQLNGVATLVVIIVVLLLLVTGIANWIGHHNILVSTAGQNRKPLKVEMAKTSEGLQFANAVKKALFK
jgi:hypothetical protein